MTMINDIIQYVIFELSSIFLKFLDLYLMLLFLFLPYIINAFIVFVV